MSPNILIESDLSHLESVLLTDGRINCLPFSELNKFSQNELSYFCLKYGIYQLPTQELIDFILKQMGDLPAIEIGSGNGCIGRSLGIKMTDNKMQERPEIKAHYDLLKQPVITYGSDVEHIDAISAVKKYQPKVVVACWVTHLWKEGMEYGNAFGIEEELLFANGVEKYIHIGNENIHMHKPILSMFPVKKYRHKTIVSRSQSREKNIIYVFTKI